MSSRSCLLRRKSAKGTASSSSFGKEATFLSCLVSALQLCQFPVFWLSKKYKLNEQLQKLGADGWPLLPSWYNCLWENLLILFSLQLLPMKYQLEEPSARLSCRFILFFPLLDYCFHSDILLRFYLNWFITARKKAAEANQGLVSITGIFWSLTTVLSTKRTESYKLSDH